MSKFDVRHKETIRLFLKEFFELFYPDICPLINFETVQFLDKELISLFEDREELPGQDRKTRTDMLILLSAKIDGLEEKILIHWEGQGEKEADFAERMFYYFCGGYYKYRKKIFPIALFTDDAEWRQRISATFKMILFRYFVCKYRFQLIKLKDYSARKFEKRQPTNPLVWGYLPLTQYKEKERPGIAAKARLGVLRTVQDEQKRATLFSLIEQSLGLSQAEEAACYQIMRKDISFKEVKMLQSFEELGFEKGYDQGVEKGIEQGITRGVEQNNLEIARLMKAEGESAERIMKFTGLSLEEQAKL